MEKAGSSQWCAMHKNCDNSNFLSRKIFHNRSCKILRNPQNPHMSLEKHLDWLNHKLSEAPHGTKKTLAEFMGISSSALSKSLSQLRELSARELEKAVEFFGDSPDTFKTPHRMVPIVGLAGAGPEGSVLFSEGDGNFGEVPAPEGASSTAEALEVRGESMRGMANDGWIIFYEDKEFPTEEHMGEPCVCWLDDGRVLVKTPYPGREPGLFELESVNAATMRDIPVRYFAFITDIKPRRSAQKFMRRHPSHQVDDVSTNGHIQDKRAAR